VGTAIRATARATRFTRAQSILLALLVVSVCINYVDRGTLSVAQGYVTRELHIGTAQLGSIFAAFFWTYAAFQLLAGYAVDRWRVKWVYAAGYLVWSLAMLATGLVTSAASLVAVRLVLGAGESVAYPAYSRMLAGDFREEQRGRANALIDAGSKLGPALGVLIGGLAMERFGWRVFFVGTGALSLLWLIPWIASDSRTIGSSERTTTLRPDPCPTFREILRERSAWGTFIGLICGNYAWYFMVFWLPPYFENERHLSHHDLAILGSGPFWGVAAVSLLSGWFSDRLIARGLSANKVRKTAVASGLLLATLMLPAMLIRNNSVSIALLTTACASFGLFSSNCWAISQTLAGPHAAGKWTGIQNALGNLPGMLGVWFTGWVIEFTGHYRAAFVIACGFLIIGAFSYLVVVRRLEPIRWSGI
jgi:ACS family D-galactonate transporter-like MFS transporter